MRSYTREHALTFTLLTPEQYQALLEQAIDLGVEDVEELSADQLKVRISCPLHLITITDQNDIVVNI
jgi:hypothetical protein